LVGAEIGDVEIRKIGDELAGGVAIERGVEGGEPDAITERRIFARRLRTRGCVAGGIVTGNESEQWKQELAPAGCRHNQSRGLVVTTY
jgi:hypothetical protein